MDLDLDGLLDAADETATCRRDRHDNADAEEGLPPSSSLKRSGNAATGGHTSGGTGITTCTSSVVTSVSKVGYDTR